jgi:hypothetical protein
VDTSQNPSDDISLGLADVARGSHPDAAEPSRCSPVALFSTESMLMDPRDVRMVGHIGRITS